MRIFSLLILTIAAGLISPLLFAQATGVEQLLPTPEAAASRSTVVQASATSAAVSDHEMVTLELTLAALNRLMHRAESGLRLLKAAETAVSPFQRNPQAEQTALEESLGGYTRKLDEKGWQSAFESLGLDLKILESRRDMLQSRYSSLEKTFRDAQEQLRQVNADLAENKKLTGDINQRIQALQSLDKTQETPLTQAKVALLQEVRGTRDTYHGLLQETQALLQKQVQQGRQDIGVGSDTLSVYQTMLPRFSQLVRRYEEKAARSSTRDLEERARSGLEAVKREQATLQEALNAIERQLLQVATASARAAPALQREVLLTQREALDETARLHEYQLRQSRILQQFGGLLRPTSAESLPPEQIDRLRQEASEVLQTLRQDLKLIQKRKELFFANRQLLEKAAADLDASAGSAGVAGRDEIKARRQQLKFHTEAGRRCVEQEAILESLIADVERVQTVIAEYQLRKREEELFGRRFLSWRPNLPSLVEEAIRGLPATLLGLMVAIAEESGIAFPAICVLLLILLPLGLQRLSVLLSTVAATPRQEDEESAAVTEPAAVPSVVRQWFIDQSPLIGLFLALSLPTFAAHSGGRLLLLPWLLSAARLLHTFLSLCMNRYGSEAPLSTAAGRRLVTVFLTFLPPILWLRQLGTFPEFLFLAEFTLKILLVLPAYSLFRHREELIHAASRLSASSPTATDLFLAWLYRGSTALVVPGLLLAIYGYQNLALWFFLKLAAIISVFLLLSIGRPQADRLAERWFIARLEVVEGERQISFVHILVRKLLRFLIWVIAIAALVKIFGLSRDFPLLSPLVAWVQANGNWFSVFLMKLGLILGMVVLSLDFCATIGESILAYVRQTEHQPNTESERRASTLVQIFRTTTRVLIFGIAGIMVLQEVGVDIKPLLTGAGILGVAIGFGSQSLIKDFFSGFFILVENQFRVGDVIDVNGKAGVVEKINLKTTVLRAVDGSIFIIPNGEITSVKNMTFTWSRAVLEVGVSYHTDIDHAMAVLQRIGDELRFHPSTKGNIVERPEVAGVERLEDSCVVLRLLVKTKPLSQWEIARIFRKRILEIFKQEGIEIPFPQRVVTLQTDPALTELLTRKP